jgi:hypothetical protein
MALSNRTALFGSGLPVFGCCQLFYRISKWYRLPQGNARYQHRADCDDYICGTVCVCVGAGVVNRARR